MFRNRLKVLALAAAVAAPLFLSAADAGAAILRNTRPPRAGTTATGTTSGQNTILTKFDPYGVSSFNLDVIFEADKAQFVEIHGLNGFIIDDFDVFAEGSTGQVLGIHGYYPGFNDRGGVGLAAAAGVPQALAEIPVNPPEGNVDIFEIVWADLNKKVDKTFTIQASDRSRYITAYNPNSGPDEDSFVTAAGPDQVDPSSVTIFGVGDPGGGQVPLPPALVVGLVGGLGVVGNAVRRRRARA